MVGKSDSARPIPKFSAGIPRRDHNIAFCERPLHSFHGIFLRRPPAKLDKDRCRLGGRDRIFIRRDRDITAHAMFRLFFYRRARSAGPFAQACGNRSPQARTAARKSAVPFKIIQKRPVQISAHVHALIHGPFTRAGYRSMNCSRWASRASASPFSVI